MSRTEMMKTWKKALQAMAWLEHWETPESVVRLAYGSDKVDHMVKEYYESKLEIAEQSVLKFFMSLDSTNRARLVEAMMDLYYPHSTHPTNHKEKLR